MKIGYTRISKQEQNEALQRDVLAVFARLSRKSLQRSLRDIST
jgi:DNA invertase Pin-like site-specific DNA recombinase